MPSLKQKLNRVQKSVQRSKENVEGDLAWYGEFISDMRTQEIAITSVKASSSFVGIVSFIALFTPLAPLGIVGLVGSGVAGAATSIGDLAASKVKGGNIDERQKRFKDDVEELSSNVQDFNETLKTTFEKTKSPIMDGIDFSTYFLSQSLGLMKGDRVMTMLDASRSGELGADIAAHVGELLGGGLVIGTPRIIEVLNDGVNILEHGQTALLVVDEIGTAAAEGCNYIGQVLQILYDATTHAIGKAGAIGHAAVGVGEGGAALAEGGAALAEGGPALAEGGAVLAEGGGALAEGGAALAEGGAVLAEGGAALAEGGAALAEGGAALAEGGAAFAEAGVALGEVVGGAAATGGRAAASVGRVAVFAGRAGIFLRAAGPILAVGGLAFGAGETIYSAFKGNPTRNAALEIKKHLLVTVKVYEDAEKTFQTFIDQK